MTVARAGWCIVLMLLLGCASRVDPGVPPVAAYPLVWSRVTPSTWQRGQPLAALGCWELTEATPGSNPRMGGDLVAVPARFELDSAPVDSAGRQPSKAGWALRLRPGTGVSADVRGPNWTPFAGDTVGLRFLGRYVGYFVLARVHGGTLRGVGIAMDDVGHDEGLHRVRAKRVQCGAGNRMPAHGGGARRARDVHGGTR